MKTIFTHASAERAPRARRGLGVLVAAALLVSQTACTTGQDKLSPEDRAGIAITAGAILGGLIGYEVIGTGDNRVLWALGLGAAGALGGKVLAEGLNRNDRAAMQDTAYRTLSDGPTGQTATWSGAQPVPSTTASGQVTDGATNGVANGAAHGSITPLRTYLDSQGRICREYDAVIHVEGERVSGRETACLTEAGHWVVFKTTG